MNTKQSRTRLSPLFSAVHFASEFSPCGEVAAGPFGFAKVLQLFNRPGDDHGRRTIAKLRQFFRKTFVLFGQRDGCLGRGHGASIGGQSALAQGEKQKNIHKGYELNSYPKIPKNTLARNLINKPNHTLLYPTLTK